MDIKSIKPNYYTLKSFEFINGRILENQIVEYITLGTHRYVMLLFISMELLVIILLSIG